MIKEQFTSGVLFTFKSFKEKPHLAKSVAFYYDGINLRRQSINESTGEVKFDFIAGKGVKVGRTGFNFTEINEMGTKSRLNFEKLVEFIY